MSHIILQILWVASLLDYRKSSLTRKIASADKLAGKLAAIKEMSATDRQMLDASYEMWVALGCPPYPMMR